MNLNMNIINIVLLCIVTISIIVYSYMYVKLNANFSSFMSKLCNINYGMFERFEDDFGGYYDNDILSWTLKYMLIIAVMLLTIIALIVLVICQLRVNCTKRRKLWEIIILIFCFINMIIYMNNAFNAKYKTGLSDNEIYIFEDKFNKEIKKNLNNMYKRKIFLIGCSFIAIAGVIAQIVYIISNYNKETEPQNNQQNNNSSFQQDNNINV